MATTLAYFDPLTAARRIACSVQVDSGDFLAPLRATLDERPRQYL